ncbi:hypothetical protein GYMLUDRAFT_249527 [Collybiopsis luxurians FD-317 M1]|uniref:Protein kinase domain-containing protein n=1 Tax=Collybiopsis luxurians FD-317 M1 TaxID=944289 RepID=A0A0D0C8U8_9AGAR|nr:hypothetical protein GYMLUDRAFT_249527 [Collybiopsis luxurians FD-317 M1]
MYKHSKPSYVTLCSSTEAPESNEPRYPYAADVFLAGTMIRLQILDGEPYSGKYGIRGFEFMRALVNDMVQNDPSKRPNMDEVIFRFSSIVDSLAWYNLRSRTVMKNERLFLKPFRALSHLVRTCGTILARNPAIPSSSR